MYYRLQEDTIPTKEAATDTYAIYFSYNFAIMLRERRIASLLIMWYDAIDFKGNLRASGKINMIHDTEHKEKGKAMDEVSTSWETKYSQESKINEMTHIINNLSNKITRIDMERTIPSKLTITSKKSCSI